MPKAMPGQEAMYKNMATKKTRREVKNNEANRMRGFMTAMKTAMAENTTFGGVPRRLVDWSEGPHAREDD